jgi:hypothetical protein
MSSVIAVYVSTPSVTEAPSNANPASTRIRSRHAVAQSSANQVTEWDNSGRNAINVARAAA